MPKWQSCIYFFVFFLKLYKQVGFQIQNKITILSRKHKKRDRVNLTEWLEAELEQGRVDSVPFTFDFNYAIANHIIYSEVKLRSYTFIYQLINDIGRVDVCSNNP